MTIGDEPTGAGPAAERYRRARAGTRYRPSWLLRRRERQIVARRPRPDQGELAELAVIRRELRVRAVPAAGWWRRG